MKCVLKGFYGNLSEKVCKKKIDSFRSVGDFGYCNFEHLNRYGCARNTLYVWFYKGWKEEFSNALFIAHMYYRSRSNLPFE